jgi:hypothetical protein
MEGPDSGLADGSGDEYQEAGTGHSGGWRCLRWRISGLFPPDRLSRLSAEKSPPRDSIVHPTRAQIGLGQQAPSLDDPTSSACATCGLENSAVPIFLGSKPTPRPTIALAGLPLRSVAYARNAQILTVGQMQALLGGGPPCASQRSAQAYGAPQAVLYPSVGNKGRARDEAFSAPMAGRHRETMRLTARYNCRVPRRGVVIRANALRW